MTILQYTAYIWQTTKRTATDDLLHNFSLTGCDSKPRSMQLLLKTL